jgi:hypothetical protein
VWRRAAGRLGSLNEDVVGAVVANDGGAPRRETKPLAVWALVEPDDGAQGIVGYTGDTGGDVVTPATGQPHFKGYEHESRRSGRAERVASEAPIEIDERPL